MSTEDAKLIDWEDDKHKAILLNLALQAKEIPPDPTDWGIFIASLQRIAMDYRNSEDNPQSRLAAIADIAYWVSFLISKADAISDADGAIRGNLRHLIVAVFDVKQGRIPDLFLPEDHKVAQNRPPPSINAQQTMGTAARALDEFHQAGIDLSEAAKKVVKAVESGRCALPGRGHQRPFSAKTVIGWRQRIKADIKHGYGEFPQGTIDRFTSALPDSAGTSHLERADFLLDTLRKGTGFR